MIETQEKAERVLLVGVQTEQYEDHKFDYLMQELISLTETAGGETIQTIRQKISRLDSRTAVGSGKLLEIKDIVDSEEITLVIFFNKLSPSVNRHLEETLSVRVFDRVQLILDIFALRAKSHEGKLQVELAQYEYLLPRIHGQGQAMSRLGAGIGTRGPGETKLESDRRHIKTIIHGIKKELKELEDHRERTRLRRQSGKEFNVGLVGYTNAGKSTLLTKLTSSDTYVQDQLFATLDPLTRQMEIHGHPSFTLTDTVGFIDELPTELIHAFRSTLEEMRYVDLLLHVVDASAPERHLYEQTVLKLIEELDLKHIPILTVYNKSDKVVSGFEPTLFPSISISAYNEQDVLRLKDQIWELITEYAEYFKVEIHPHEADLIALYRNKTLVESLDFDEELNLYWLSGYRRRTIEEE